MVVRTQDKHIRRLVELPPCKVHLFACQPGTDGRPVIDVCDIKGTIDMTDHATPIEQLEGALTQPPGGRWARLLANPPCPRGFSHGRQCALTGSQITHGPYVIGCQPAEQHAVLVEATADDASANA